METPVLKGALCAYNPVSKVEMSLIPEYLCLSLWRSTPKVPGRRAQTSGLPGAMERGAMAGQYLGLGAPWPESLRNTVTGLGRLWAPGPGKRRAARGLWASGMLFTCSFIPCFLRNKPKHNVFISVVGTDRSPAPISRAYANACHSADRGPNSAPGTSLRAHGAHSQLARKANFHGSQSIGRSNKTTVTFTPSVLTTAYWRHVSWLQSISN